MSVYYVHGVFLINVETLRTNSPDQVVLLKVLDHVTWS